MDTQDGRQLYIKWLRPSANGTAIPHYKYEGEINWRPYTSYHRRKPDVGMSKGMTTFQLWLKEGGIIDPGVGIS